MATKGHQNKRGQPEFYDVLKKRYNLMLTPTSAERLDEIASSLGLSRSELVERIGRGIYPITIPSQSQSTPTLSADYADELGELSAS